MPKNFSQGNIAYHPQLAPEAWQKNRLRREIRYKLLNSAKYFIQSLNIPGFRLLDIVLTGSMANYNYTRYSDFDVHVITNYQDLDCDDVAEELYRAKKSIWNERHDIVVRGHEVEMYVEDVNEPPVSAGMYSLLDDQWLRIPSYRPPGIDDRALNNKVHDLIRLIEKTMVNADDPDDIDRLSNKLRKMRQAGLDANGEYSVENLAYKILRNLGYLDRLYQAYNQELDQDLGL